MAIFNPVIFGWGGNDYTVPAERVLGLVAEIEEVITFTDLIATKDRPNLSKLARAYSAALRYAGAKISDEEVYQGLFKPGGAVFLEMQKAIIVLMAIMMPPGAVTGANSEAGSKSGASFGGNSQAAPTRSSKRSSKRRSAAAG